MLDYKSIRGGGGGGGGGRGREWHVVPRGANTEDCFPYEHFLKQKRLLIYRS